MKIFYIINGRLPTEKANGYQVSQMCQAFIENGASCKLLRPTRVLPSEHKGYRNNIQEFYNLRKSPELIDIRCLDFLYFFHKYLPFLDRFQILWNFLNILNFSLALVFYFRKVEYDKESLIYLRDVNVLSILYPFLPERLKDKVVVELHYVPTRESRRKRYAKILRRCHRIVAITEKMKESLVALGVSAEKVLVEHDGVDVGTFSIELTKEECRDIHSLPQEKTIIGYVGNFHTNGREKGIDDLIKSSGDLLLKNENVEYLFVGGPLDRVPKYEALIDELGFSRKRFSFRDRVSVKEVPTVMKACDILTIPLPWNEHFAYYMSPMKLFEYMSTGVAIFSTDVPGVAEVLKHKENSFMVRHSSIEEMSKGLCEFVEDIELQKRVAQKALSEVGYYTWRNRAKRIGGGIFE